MKCKLYFYGFILLYSLLAVCAEREAGIVRITNPSQGLKPGSVAFLVDRAQGLFATICVIEKDEAWVAPDFQPFLLESKDHKVMRARMVGRVEGFALLQVKSDDRAMLATMPVFQFDKMPVSEGQDLSVFSGFDACVWRKRRAERVEYDVDRNMPGVYSLTYGRAPRGSPVLNAQGLVSGIVYGSYHWVYPSQSADLHLQYFLKTGKSFAGHLGGYVYARSVQDLEKDLGMPFDPIGFDAHKTHHKTVMSVKRVFMDTLSAEDLPQPSLRPHDVILSLNDNPVYTSLDIMRHLMDADLAGQRSILVRGWRFGKIFAERMTMRDYDLKQPNEFYTYGPCAFMEVGHQYDAKRRYVQAVLMGSHIPAHRYKNKLLKINGSLIQGLADVERALTNAKGQELFLHLYPAIYSSDFFAKSSLSGGRHCLVHVPQAAGVASYVHHKESIEGVR